MENTLLSPEAEMTIIQGAHRFDGYAWSKERKPAEEPIQYLGEMLRWVLGTGKLFSDPIENFAVNFYLHRDFASNGWLPAAFTPKWYQMVFFYLHLYRTPTPPIYQHKTSESEWRNRPKGAAEAAAIEIRRLLMQQRPV